MSNESIQTFASFLQANKDLFDKRIQSYRKNTGKPVELGRLFNEMPIYPGINQTIINSYQLALEFGQLDRWYQQIMSYVVSELFDSQGEIIEPIKKFFIAAGIDSDLFTKNDFKTALIADYFTNILGPITGKLAKDKRDLMEEASLLDNPQDDPIYKDQKASGNVTLKLEKIDETFVHAIHEATPNIQTRMNDKYAEILLQQWVNGENINQHLEKFNFDQVEALRHQVQDALDNHQYPESTENLTVFFTELTALKKFKLFDLIINEDDYPAHYTRFIKEELSIKELDSLIAKLTKAQKNSKDIIIKDRIALELPLLQAIQTAKKPVTQLNATKEPTKKSIEPVETKVKFKDDANLINVKTIPNKENTELTDEERVQIQTSGLAALIKSAPNTAAKTSVTTKNLEISGGIFGKGFFGRLKSYIKAHPIKSILIGATIVVGVGAFIAGCIFSGGTLAAATGIAATLGTVGLGGIGIVGGAALTSIGLGTLGYQTKKHAQIVNKNNKSTIDTYPKDTENLFKTDIAVYPIIDLTSAETIYQGRYQILLASQYKTTITEIDQFYQQHKTALDNVKNLDLSIAERRMQITPIHSELRAQREKLDKAIAVTTVQRQTTDQKKGELKKQIEFLTLHLADARPMLQEMLRFYTDAKIKALAASQELVVEGDKAVLYLEKFLKKFNENQPIYLSDLSASKFSTLYTAIDNLRKLINAVANIDDHIKNEHNAIVTGQYMPVINAYFSKQQTFEALPKELQAKINKKEKNLAALLEALAAKKPVLKEIETQALIERTYSDFMSDMSVKLQAAEHLLDQELIEGISLERLTERTEHDPKLTMGLNWETFGYSHGLIMPDGPIDLSTLQTLNPNLTIQIQLHPELTVLLQAMNQSLNLSIADTMAINDAFNQLKNNKIATDDFIELFKEKTQLETLSRAFIASLPVSIVQKTVNTNQVNIVPIEHEPEPVLPEDDLILDEPAPQIPSMSVMSQETNNQATTTDQLKEIDTVAPQHASNGKKVEPVPATPEIADNDQLILPVTTDSAMPITLASHDDELEDSDFSNAYDYEPEPISPDLLEIQEKLMAIDIQQRIQDSQKNAAIRISQKSMQSMNQQKVLITLDEFLEVCKTLKNYAITFQNLPGLRTTMEILVKSATKYFLEKLAMEIKLLTNPETHIEAEKLNSCLKECEKLKMATAILPENLHLQAELLSLAKLSSSLDALIKKEQSQHITELQVATATFNKTTPPTLLTVQPANSSLTYQTTQDGRYSDYKRPNDHTLSTSKDTKRGYTDDEKIVIKSMVDTALQTGETRFEFHGDKDLCRKAARNLLAALPAANIFINGANKAYQPDLKERIEISSKRREFKIAERIKQKHNSSEPTPPTIGSAA